MTAAILSRAPHRQIYCGKTLQLSVPRLLNCRLYGKFEVSRTRHSPHREPPGFGRPDSPDPDDWEELDAWFEARAKPDKKLCAESEKLRELLAAVLPFVNDSMIQRMADFPRYRSALANAKRALKSRVAHLIDDAPELYENSNPSGSPK